MRTRWLTGRRNINVIPSLVVSYQGDKPRAARLFFDLRYLLALDTEPYATDPLTGVPPAVVPGHNVILKACGATPSHRVKSIDGWRTRLLHRLAQRE